ncbi:L-histidine N(alpha)-methyltransferase [Nocardioides insulae]|uniref:L-histidine N(alpha)-methyltransferase n=1 Tax=Nocardioides insulae TaxID=394734 RepID=UPI001FE14968|nr:L-histidine N(alpha)-methyltransferase [Nocardioides insulae]
MSDSAHARRSARRYHLHATSAVSAPRPRQASPDELAQDRLEVLLGPDDLRQGLERDALIGLSASPKWLPPKYFYDDRGSILFEQITRLPEYYQTRTEHAILTAHAADIAETSGAQVVLELGSGSSAKTRLLLDAFLATGRLSGYVPVDVSAGALRAAMTDLRRDYPGLALHGAVADFDRHLDELPAPGTRMVVFLGGTLGNHPPETRGEFLAALSAAMRPGETLLLGVDLVKDPDRLIAAYDDSAGVTAAFNRNVLAVLDRELGGDLDPSDFAHRAVWEPDREWIEMRLRAVRPVRARLEGLDLDLAFAEGEELRTEISAKFRREGITAELGAAGLTVEHWWTDDAEDFAVLLARR